MKSKLVIIVSAIIILVIAIYYIPSKPDSTNKYGDFEQLENAETIDEDYTIDMQESDSNILLMAIHGGGIEPGTTEIADYLASENGYSYYSFSGIKQKGNYEMHIASTNFDEPNALEIASNSSVTLSFHGYDSEDKHTYIGGLDKELTETLKSELTDANFSVSDPPKKFAGEEKDNITNRNKNKQGVQIEISTAQREAFFKNNSLSSDNRENKQDKFYEYAKAIEKAIND